MPAVTFDDTLDWLGSAYTETWTVRLVPRFVASAGESPQYVVEVCHRFPDGFHLGYLADTAGLRRTFSTLETARNAARAFLDAPDLAQWVEAWT